MSMSTSAFLFMLLGICTAVSYLFKLIDWIEK